LKRLRLCGSIGGIASGFLIWKPVRRSHTHCNAAKRQALYTAKATALPRAYSLYTLKAINGFEVYDRW
jgi:hypothetical protein